MTGKEGAAINQVFKELDKPRQEKIWNAAFEEFAGHGYKKASTNRIVETAGISKGMLFYYFNSKKELYQDLIEYGISCIKDDYLHLIDETQADFIEKFRQASVIKLKAFHDNPHILNFFGSIYLNPEEAGLSEAMLKEIGSVQELGYAKFYAHVDTSLFRTDLPPEQITKLIRWCMDGYEKQLEDELKGKSLTSLDYEPYWEKFYQFLDTLKIIFYQ